MNHGAYMYYENNKHYLFVYAKLPVATLVKAIPLTYKINEGEFLTAIFVNGIDYLGQTKYENISNMIKKDGVVDIVNNDYDEIKKILPELTEEEYNENIAFIGSQVKELNKEILKECNSCKFLYNNLSIIINGTYNDIEDFMDVDFKISEFNLLKKLYNDLSNEKLEILKEHLYTMSDKDLFIIQ